MKVTISTIIPGIAAGLVLAIFLFLLQAGIPLSIGAGVLTYIGSMLVLPKGKKQLMVFVAEGITEEEVTRVLAEGRGKISAIERSGSRIENKTVREQVFNICALSSKIVGDLEKDPRSIKNARKFLSYYLDTTAYIVNRYAELSTEAVYSEQVQLMLQKVEETLTVIQQTFMKQMERLLQDDVDDLDIELELLHKTIKMEGI